MNDFDFWASHLLNDEAFERYMSKFCFELDVFAVEKNKLECVTKLCKMGESSVSLTSSPTGWGYKVRSEADGFLLTIPKVGNITWVCDQQRLLSKVNTGILIDHRELTLASYSQSSHYLTIYISHLDITRYMTVLNGEIPTSRIIFKTAECGELATIFMKDLGATILSLAAKCKHLEEKVFIHLKESLICFIIYNLDNNYSERIRSVKNLEIPAPFNVKKTMEFIEHNYKKLLTLSDLSAHAGISARGLQLGFKQFKNCSPMQYLREVRLKRANVMLRAKNSAPCSPKEIAELCGFTNFYLFEKYYKATYGERPVDTLRLSNPA